DTRNAMPNAAYAQAQAVGTGMKGIVAAIQRDPASGPTGTSLEEAAQIAGDQRALGEAATVFQTLQQVMREHGNDPSIGLSLGIHFGLSGDLANIISNITGLRQTAVDTDVNRVQAALANVGGGDPQKANQIRSAVNAVMSLFAVLPAMRQVSKNPVYNAAMSR